MSLCRLRSDKYGCARRPAVASRASFSMEHLPLLPLRVGSVSKEYPDLFMKKEPEAPAMFEGEDDQIPDDDPDPLVMAGRNVFMVMMLLLARDVSTPANQQYFREKLLELFEAAEEVIPHDGLMQALTILLDGFPAERNDEAVALARRTMDHWHSSAGLRNANPQHDETDPFGRVRMRGDEPEDRGAPTEVAFKRKRGYSDAALTQLTMELQAMLLDYVMSGAQIARLKRNVAEALQRARAARVPALDVFMRAAVTLYAAPDSGTKLAMEQAVGQWYATAV